MHGSLAVALARLEARPILRHGDVALGATLGQPLQQPGKAVEAVIALAEGVHLCPVQVSNNCVNVPIEAASDMRKSSSPPPCARTCLTCVSMRRASWVCCAVPGIGALSVASLLSSLASPMCCQRTACAMKRSAVPSVAVPLCPLVLNAILASGTQPLVECFLVLIFCFLCQSKALN